MIRRPLLKYWLFLLAVMTAQVCADTPVPFGLLLQYPNATPDAVSLAAEAPLVQRDIDLAEVSVAEMERALGPYHADLAAPTLALARLVLSEGDLERAAALYDKALHIARINDGLYGDQQVPILRGLLDLYLLAGDRQAFEARAEYQFRLLGSGEPPFEEGELSAAQVFFDASLDALMDVPWAGRGRELMAFHDRVESLTNQICDDPVANQVWCQPFSFDLMRFYYVLEHKLDVFVDDPRFEPRFTDREWQSLDREPRLEALQRRLFRKGETVLSRLLEVNPDNHDAVSALADWHWFYRKRSQALGLYQQACQMMPDRFDTPAPLPEYPQLSRNLAFNAEYTRVLAQLDVTDQGFARDVAAETLSGDVSGRARRLLRNTVFRPALDRCDTQAVDAVFHAEVLHFGG